MFVASNRQEAVAGLVLLAGLATWVWWSAILGISICVGAGAVIICRSLFGEHD